MTEKKSEEIVVPVRMNVKELYRFNMYHSYHSSQGWLSLMLTALCGLVAVLSLADNDWNKGIIYLGLTVLLAVYVPVSLRMKTAAQYKRTKEFHDELTYAFNEEGISIKQGEANGVLPWDQVYKLVVTKKQLLIYGSRVRAFVIPLDFVGEKLEAIKEMSRTYLKPYRIKMK